MYPLNVQGFDSDLNQEFQAKKQREKTQIPSLTGSQAIEEAKAYVQAYPQDEAVVIWRREPTTTQVVFEEIVRLDSEGWFVDADDGKQRMSEEDVAKKLA